MSKSLEALKRIKWKLEDEGILGEEYESCDAIKTELKRLEEIDNILNAGGGIWAENGIVSKELKALKITKEKDVDIFALKFSINLKQYNCKEDGRCPLTQEEYDLLREVLL